MKEWSKRFRMGQGSLEDDARTGRLVEVVTNNNIVLVEDLVLFDRRLKAKEIAQKWGLSDTTVCWIVHDYLGTNKMSARFVNISQQFRASVVLNVLGRFWSSTEKILSPYCRQLPQGMTPWFCTMSLCMYKRELMEGRRNGEASPKKFKVCQSTKKGDGYDLLRFQGIPLMNIKERNTTVNRACYAVRDCGFQ